MALRPGTVDGHSPPWLGQTRPQLQKHACARGVRLGHVWLGPFFLPSADPWPAPQGVVSRPGPPSAAPWFGRGRESWWGAETGAWACLTEDTFQNVTPNSATMSPRTREDPAVLPSPTSETVLTVAAFGVISFIAILVVVVIVLVSVVSLRFKCRKNKESEDPQKPGSSGVSESCSTANGEKDSITLISMKNINMNNSKGCPTAEKVL
ncbi:endothelial cell-specific chemotaxis regulator isoform X1 [Manis pentadactyla]|uniref:endothelial cell-specific chemotaxis regulator isoform X1 n=1 Tax=Manis pentadactyla TaxID=143292 RepID=UPI00255C40F5|nr:endothelial cell-specific chemotaxis regulator isoform X1 [Manis pentadactyla]